MSRIISGDYKGQISYSFKKNQLYIEDKSLFSTNTKFLCRETVRAYKVVDEETKTSFGSSVARSVAGAAVFGVAGAVAGAATAKKKTTRKVSVIFRDGTRVLLELGKTDYDIFINSLY